MSVKVTPPPAKRAAETIGTQLAAWRKIQDLTAQQVVERANISRDTLRRLAHGEVGVSRETVPGVARAVGALDRLVDALDPWHTDLGRARAASALPQRVRDRARRSPRWSRPAATVGVAVRRTRGSLR